LACDDRKLATSYLLMFEESRFYVFGPRSALVDHGHKASAMSTCCVRGLLQLNRFFLVEVGIILKVWWGAKKFLWVSVLSMNVCSVLLLSVFWVRSSMME
jgi:hypothetical protein